MQNKLAKVGNTFFFSPKGGQNYLKVPSFCSERQGLRARTISQNSNSLRDKRLSQNQREYLSIRRGNENLIWERRNDYVKESENKNLERLTDLSCKEVRLTKQHKFLGQNLLQTKQTRCKSITIYPSILTQRSLNLPQRKFYSEQTKPVITTYRSLRDNNDGSEITCRLHQIERTKIQVKQFKKGNQELLSDIKLFREKVTRRLRSMGELWVENSVSKVCEDEQIQQLVKTFSDDDFIALKKLGSGAFASVFLAQQKQTGCLVTLKKISRSLLTSPKSISQLITEIKLQLYVSHPNIVKMYGFYIDTQHITLILQFMQQGSLYQKLTKQKVLTQKQASQSINQVLFALQYLHKNHIVHRDIKPENVVSSYGVNKLCDFGTAARCEDRRSTLCGTLDYSAPQMMQGGQYNKALDVWSLGVMVFQLLTGKPPFYHLRRRDTIKQITQYQDGEIEYPQKLSIYSRQFIAGFLVKDPQNRIMIDEAFRHQFIAIHADVETIQLRQKYSFNKKG